MPASTMQPNLDQLNGLTGVRAAALARWQESGWPDRKAEAWRFTRLSAIDKMDLRPAIGGGSTAFGLPTELPDGAVILSFYNGVLDMTGLASLPDGVKATRLEDDDGVLSAFSALLPIDHPVTSLSIAAMGSGLCLEITGCVETPIVLAYGGDDNGLSAHPALFVKLQAGAAAVIAEWHQSDVGLSAPLAAFELGEKARLDYAKVQHDSGATTHLAATGLRLAEGAAFDGLQISAGGRLARLETHVTLCGEHADCTLSAIYLGRDSQHHDITTNMAHLKGHCNSNQVIRGVLDDNSRGVFQGKVHVAPDAQKTDGNQMSRALLLSRKAEADTKPELEIYADDVLCAHGATVGELDVTQLFYLTSRGIPTELARAMLIEAFLEDAIDGISNAQLAALLRPVMQAWMARGDAA